MRRLPRRAVLRHLDRLADALTGRQLDRLRALADLIGDDGRIPLPRALDAATPGGDDTKAQDAFRKFRAALDDAAHAAGVDLRLVSDQSKAPPRGRFCWFEGADVTGDEVAERSGSPAASWPSGRVPGTSCSGPRRGLGGGWAGWCRRTAGWSGYRPRPGVLSPR